MESVSKSIYIIPSPDTPCPAQACYTLMQYVNRTSLCQISNVALIFMPGNHVLGIDLSITNKSCFSMSAYSYNTSSSCTVMCVSSSRMTLSSIETVVIRGISFTNCGGNTARYVDSFILKDSNFIMNPHSNYMYRGRAWSVIGSETLSVDSCTFTTNAAYYRGGALYISAVTNTIITLCTLILITILLLAVEDKGELCISMQTTALSMDLLFLTTRYEVVEQKGVQYMSMQ